ncbi:hypothetical protein WR25_20999 [Diploscapter pachys]|uniref:Uncharacterized protein n=1 Tax=Diploscapter pachys TaxID=2018661 RepID=A0A2A2K3Y4_9BILA|nr:hypothetical protein WR25_20999 [Diploscapter pachys]
MAGAVVAARHHRLDPRRVEIAAVALAGIEAVEALDPCRPAYLTVSDIGVDRPAGLAAHRADQPAEVGGGQRRIEHAICVGGATEHGGVHPVQIGGEGSGVGLAVGTIVAVGVAQPVAIQSVEPFGVPALLDRELGRGRIGARRGREDSAQRAFLGQVRRDASADCRVHAGAGVDAHRIVGLVRLRGK